MNYFSRTRKSYTEILLENTLEKENFIFSNPDTDPPYLLFDGSCSLVEL